MALGARDGILRADSPFGPPPPVQGLVSLIECQADSGFARVHLLACVDVLETDQALPLLVHSPPRGSGENLEAILHQDLGGIRLRENLNLHSAPGPVIWKDGIRLTVRTGQAAKIIARQVRVREVKQGKAMSRVVSDEIARHPVQHERERVASQDHLAPVFQELQRARIRPRQFDECLLTKLDDRGGYQLVVTVAGMNLKLGSCSSSGRDRDLEHVLATWRGCHGNRPPGAIREPPRELQLLEVGERIAVFHWNVDRALPLDKLDLSDWEPGRREDHLGQPVLGFGPPPGIDDAPEAVVPGIASMPTVREIERVVERSPDRSAGHAARLDDMRPCPGRDARFHVRPSEGQRALTAPRGSRVAMPSPEVLAQSRVDTHIRLLVAHREEILAKNKGSDQKRGPS